MSLLKKAAKNSTYLSFGNIVTMIFPFIFAGVRIKYLGMDKAGFLILLESLIGLSFSLGGFGFGTAALRKIAIFEKKGDKDGAAKTLSAVLILSLLTGIVIFSLILFNFNLIFSWSKTPLHLIDDAFYAFIFTGFYLLARQLFGTYEVVFSSFQRYDIISIINTIFSFLTPMFGFFTIYFVPTMTALSISLLCVALTRVIVDLFLVRRILGKYSFPIWNSEELKSLSSFGLWAYFSSISEVGIGNLDKYILTNFLGSKILPYYVIGQQMVQKVHGFLSGQSQFLFPMLSFDDSNVNIIIKKVEDRLRWFIATMSILIYGSLIFIAKDLLTLLVSYNFANQASIYFQIACVQGIFMAMDIVPFYLSYAAGKGVPNAVIPWVNSALASLLIILLVPAVGILGASYAKLTYLLSNFIFIYWVMKLGDRYSFYHLVRPFITPVLLATIWGGVFFLSHHYFNTSLLFTFIQNGVAAIIAIAISTYIEYQFFKEEKCVDTLIILKNIFKEKISINFNKRRRK